MVSSRASPGEAAGPLAGGAALAALVSVLRVLTIVGFVAPGLLWHLAPPALAGAAVFGSVAALLLWRRTTEDGVRQQPHGNPFELKPLLVFALAFVVVAFVAAWLTQRVGGSGLLVSSAVFGAVDVDVATLTAARLAGVSVTANQASDAILLALAVNAVTRVIFGSAAGSTAYALRLAGAAASALAVAVVVFFLLG